MFKPKPLYHRRKSASGVPRGEASSGGNGKMLGTRILRTVTIVGVFLVLAVLLHAGLLYPQGQCLASLDMAQEPIEAESFYGDHNAKQVDLYAPFDVIVVRLANVG